MLLSQQAWSRTQWLLQWSGQAFLLVCASSHMPRADRCSEPDHGNQSFPHSPRTSWSLLPPSIQIPHQHEEEVRYSKGCLGHQCLEKIPGQLGPKFTPPLCSDRCGPQGKRRGGAKPQGYKRGHPALRPFRTNFWNSWFLIPRWAPPRSEPVQVTPLAPSLCGSSGPTSGRPYCGTGSSPSTESPGEDRSAGWHYL